MIENTHHLTGFVTAYTILLVGCSSPGPSVAMLTGIATNQGRQPALVATLGIAFGSMTINILTLLGIGLLLSQAAWAMSLLKFVGVAYLLYLAYGSLRKAINPPSIEPLNPAQSTALKHFVAGYLLQITNPKAIAFWLAISSVGAVDGASLQVVILFVVGAFVISYGGHAVWAVALSSNPIRAVYLAGRRWIEATLGCFFMLAAFKVALSENTFK